MGGVESHCEELYPRIAKLNPDLDITVIARRANVGDAPYRFNEISVIPLRAVRSMHFEAIVSTFLGVLFAFRRGAEILHIHAIGPALTAPLARLLGMRVVVTHHGEDFNRRKWSVLPKWFLRLGERFALSFAHRVIAVSPSIAARLKADYPRAAHKVAYIPNGAPHFAVPAEVSLATVQSLGLEPKNYILGVGRLVPEKGFDCLIDAFRQSAIPGLKLAIVGGSDHDTHYARTLHQKADPSILLLGKRSRETLASLYEHCRAFALPSSHEALAIVALEAASCGAPVLVSDIEANRNFQLPDAHYFPLDDAGALAGLMRNLPQGFAAANERLVQLFDWDESARTTDALFRELIREMRGADLRAPESSNIAAR